MPETVDSPTNQVLEQALEASFQGVVLVAAHAGQLCVEFANREFERLTGFSRVELQDGGWPMLQRDDESGQPLRAALARGQPFRGIVACSRRDGSSARLRMRVEPLAPEGETKYWLCQCLDVSDAALDEFDGGVASDTDTLRLRERFNRLDRVDASSGLLKYDRFRDFLDRDLAIAQREQQSIAVMMLEIVELDKYRETFGKNAADSCLRMIGKQVTATLRRATDLCARFADDAIVAAVFGQNAQEADQLRERISENIQGLRIHNPRGQTGRFLHVRSIVADAIPGQESCDSLVRRLRAELEADPAPERSYA